MSPDIWTKRKKRSFDAAPVSRSTVIPPPGRQSESGKPAKSRTELLITGGILTAAATLTFSLLAYFRPFSSGTVQTAVNNFSGYISQLFTKPEEPVTEPGFLSQEEPTMSEETEEGSRQEQPEEISQMVRTDELGEISDMNAESVFPPQDTIYSCMLDTAMGPLLYYNQGDIRWKEYLYGGQDRVSKYGCGPVCVAMIINSFSSQGVTPVEMADWSAANGYYARQSGSYHGLIPGSLSAFGLQVESVTERTPERVSELLSSGHVLVALMGKGSLTQNGHFIIIAQLCGNGNVYIADPASYENSTKEWDLQLLMNELKRSYDSGGPLWAVSYRDGEIP
ncbi:MAG: hypothetical protein HFG77_09155 [Hungatella sp.]|jgi:hypothetical protein|nr:hypothetical protein [Hungatella sp.]